MLFANLKTALKTEIKPAYLLTGSDVFLINKAIELILSAAKIDALNVIKIDEDTDATEINSLSRNQSMFGGATATIVRGLTETKIILDPSSKIIEPVDCNPMSQDVVTKLIINQFTQEGKTVNQATATHLATSQNNDYSRINNEIIKLINFYKDKKELTVDDISPLISKTEEFQVYELGNALLKKDLNKATTIYNNLVAINTDEYALFGSLVSLIKRLFYALSSPMTDAELGAYLKCHPYAVTATRRDGRHLKDTIINIYKTALELEYKIKSGQISCDHAIILLKGALL